MSTNVTVWYDSQCPLCVREIRLMRRLDKRQIIRFVDIYGDEGCPVDRETLLARFHAREGSGPMLSGASAFAAMWRAIPLLRPLGIAARFRPIAWVLEKAYLFFLRIRPGLQRLTHRLMA